MTQLVSTLKAGLASAYRTSRTVAGELIAADEGEYLSDRRLNLMVRLYLFSLFVVLTALSWDMGLHADDYWVISEMHARSVPDYFDYFLNQVNSRYTIVGINSFFVKLFYVAGDPFNHSFIRIEKIGGFMAHLFACWLLFLSLRRMGVPRIGVFIAFPLMALPTYGWEGFLWNSAVLGYSFGFLFFMTAVYAFTRGWTLLFGLATFLAMGATEYILAPSFVLGIILAIRKWRALRGTSFRRRAARTVLELVTALAPFVLWAVISFGTDALAARSATVNHNKSMLITEDPWQWVITFFERYSIGMQPYEWVREKWYVVPSVIALGVIAAPGWRNRLVALFAAGFYFASIAPMAAVGYNFLNAQLDGIILRSSRLFYFPGIFYCVALAVAVAFILLRAQMLLSKWSVFAVARRRAVRWAATGAMLAYVGGVTGYYVHDVKTLAKGSEDAFGCLQGFVETIYEETKGVPPKMVSVCGLPPIVGHSPIFRGPYSGPYSLGLKYGLHRRIPLRRHFRCPRTMEMNFDHPQCKYRAAYRIQK
ncbi:MAG: hypothetical protein JXX29_12955 [Deltaproteobacteria bacterium]|nr:hypothetical protein [Deltaproteobacteria bacterium]MBN2672586.1 hypothetical protein [Deltaproteobacteria bacterium]